MSRQHSIREFELLVSGGVHEVPESVYDREARASGEFRVVREQAIAHRNAFYHLAGGDKKGNGFKYPNLLLDTTVAVLRGAAPYDIVQIAEAPLQTLATGAKTRIEMESTNLKKTLVP